MFCTSSASPFRFHAGGSCMVPSTPSDAVFRWLLSHVTTPRQAKLHEQNAGHKPPTKHQHSSDWLHKPSARIARPTPGCFECKLLVQTIITSKPGRTPYADFACTPHKTRPPIHAVSPPTSPSRLHTFHTPNLGEPASPSRLPPVRRTGFCFLTP